MSNITSISVGEILRQELMKNEAISSRVTKIFPVAVDEAKLPYLVYRKTGFQQALVENRPHGADTVFVEVIAFAKTYRESLFLAEEIRVTLDGLKAVHLCSDFGIGFASDFGGAAPEDLVMRNCYLTDASEAYIANAYTQSLIFTIKL